MFKITPSDLKGFNSLSFNAFATVSTPRSLVTGFKITSLKGLPRWTFGYQQPLLTPAKFCEKLNVFITKGFKNNQEMQVRLEKRKTFAGGIRNSAKAKTFKFKNGMYKVE